MEARLSGTSALIASRRFVLAVGTALALNLAALGLGSAAGATWEVSAPVSITAVGVLATTLLTMVAGGAAVTYLRRRGRADRILVRGGLVFAIATAASPFMASGDTATSVALAAMHVITGLAWFVAVRGR